MIIMPTWNKELHSLTKEDVERISLEYLMGWHDLMANGHGFRLKGFNHMREKYGMEPLTKEMSMEYRIDYIKSHYTDDEIYQIIQGYLRDARVGDTRWTGIELFGCRFGREYAKAFKRLLGAREYRAVSEVLRNRKSMSTQMERYGGIGLAGAEAKQKAMQTNLERYGGTNVMHNSGVKQTLAHTNRERYGGASPFSDAKVREKSLKIKRPELYEAMLSYKKTGVSGNPLCESHSEFAVFRCLCDRFGPGDVFSQYGIHPSDPRYPYNCDFYIRSLDLFIELNLYYTHGFHWFDETNPHDLQRLECLNGHGSRKDRRAIDVWTRADPEKRKKAKESGIRYLVFWGDSRGNVSKKSGLPEDFELWFFRYGCNYELFIEDHPGNTY